MLELSQSRNAAGEKCTALPSTSKVSRPRRPRLQEKKQEEKGQDNVDGWR